MPRLSHHDLRRNFRELLNADRCFHTASVFDPMSARIAADLGFEVGILGGSVASLQVLAAPDFNLITLSEFVEQATRICRVAQLPVLADADHGYGNALNVMRTVSELERAGISALTIEDTLLPPPCCHPNSVAAPPTSSACSRPSARFARRWRRESIRKWPSSVAPTPA